MSLIVEELAANAEVPRSVLLDQLVAARRERDELARRLDKVFDVIKGVRLDLADA